MLNIREMRYPAVMPFRVWCRMVPLNTIKCMGYHRLQRPPTENPLARVHRWMELLDRWHLVLDQDLVPLPPLPLLPTRAHLPRWLADRIVPHRWVFFAT